MTLATETEALLRMRGPFDSLRQGTLAVRPPSRPSISISSPGKLSPSSGGEKRVRQIAAGPYHRRYPRSRGPADRRPVGDRRDSGSCRWMGWIAWGAASASSFRNPRAALNPIRTIGEQIGDVLRIHRGVAKRDLRDTVVEALIAVRIPDAPRRNRRLSRRVVGWHVPARHAGRRAGRRAGSADR